MIDSNTLNQLGATLRHQAEIDRSYGENIAAGPWAALRLGMRMDADAKRRDIDFVNAHKDAVLLEQAKQTLAGPQGEELLDKERRGQFAADKSVDRSPEEVKEALYYNEAPSVEELKRLNPEVNLLPAGWENIRKNWGKGQSANYAWSTATGKIYKKPQSGTMEDEDLFSLLAENDKNNEALMRYQTRMVPKDEEKLYQEWYAKKYGAETEEARKKRADELFNADYDEKFKGLFANEEDVERFRKLSEDPRLTRFDPETGRRVLKRDDELYYDLGNYDQYMAPEMAPPYFERAKDLMMLNKDRWHQTISALDKKVQMYEAMAQHSRAESNQISFLIAQGNANMVAAELEGDDEKAEQYHVAVEKLRERVQSLEADAKYNHEMARVSNDKSEEIRNKGPLAYMSGVFAGQNFFSGLYSQNVLDQIGMAAEQPKVRPAGPEAKSWEEMFMQQEAADAAREGFQFSGEDAVPQYANMDKSYMPLSALATGARAAYGASDLSFHQRTFRLGQLGNAPNQPYSVAYLRPLYELNSPSTYVGDLERIANAMAQGGAAEDLHGGLLGFRAGETITRPLVVDRLSKLSTAHMVKWLMDLTSRNAETDPYKNDYTKKHALYTFAKQNVAFKKSVLGKDKVPQQDLLYLNKVTRDWEEAKKAKKNGKPARGI